MLDNFKFTSNTLAGCANQHYFISDGTKRTSRAYFKIFAGGEYTYSISFSGVLDSSYRRISFHDEPCSGWTICRAKVGRLSSFPSDISPESITLGEVLDPEWISELSFSGERGIVAPSGAFSADPIKLSFSEGEYLCLEIEYFGEKIPCHPEVAIPVYTMAENGLWEFSKNMPLPQMIGCDRQTSGNIAYLGDSITQGADMPTNCYGHWMARLAERLPRGLSHWNLGIGLGKTTDVSAFGAWYQKALCADTVFVCYGVNDINADFSAEYIFDQLSSIVKSLKSLGKRVIVQHVPPFTYTEERRATWYKINEYIREKMAALCDLVFDQNAILSDEAEPSYPKYGGHPSEEGCELWANALYEKVKGFFEF